MDNRIPQPVRDHLAKQERESRRADAKGFLAFDDWLADRGNSKSHGFITVAEDNLLDIEQRLTTSYMVPIDRVGKMLTNERFDGFSVEDGLIAAVGAFLGNESSDHAHDSPKAPGAKPFALHRYYHNYIPSALELIQAFELYWNAWWDDDVLRRIDLGGQLHDVATRSKAERCRRIAVDAHHLKAFLSANDCALVRLHAHRRFSKDALEASVEEFVRDESGIFEVRAANVSGADYTAQGDLVGRDFVLPYPTHSGPRATREEFQTFAIGRDDQGAPREATCNPEAASSYFRDTGREHFLTPVFFRAGVLRRYYAEPQRFSVERATVTCLDLWNIPYERNEDIIQVYLGDLGPMPYVEQRHWRPFNEIVDAGISPDRFARDFMTQWTAPTPDAAFDLLRAVESVNITSEAAFGSVLFRALSAADDHVRTGLRVPLEDSAEEADSQLTFCAKIIIEALDNDLLRAQIPKDIDVKGHQGLRLLEILLASLATPENAVELMRPLFNIYYLRSTGSAHYRGSAWEETLERSGLVGLTFRDLVKEAFLQAAESLVGIQAILSNAGNAKTAS